MARCRGQTKSGKQCSREAQEGSDYCYQHQPEEVNEELTDKQRMFIEEYLIDLNATQAAIRAGYSEDTARQIASENLSKPYIQEAIQEAKQERIERTKITQDKVLQELAKIGFANIKDYLSVEDFEIEAGFELDENGQPDKSKPIKKLVRGVKIFETEQLDDDKASAISEIRQTKTGISLKLHDKIKALEDIGRHLGMFNDKLNINADVVTQDVTQLSKEERKKKLQELRDKLGDS
jgi:phage terminase small subunit